MKKIIAWLKNIIRLIVRFIKRQRTWLIYDLGSNMPIPSSVPQDKSPFEHEENEREVVRIRESKHCYQRHSELLTFLASETIDRKLRIGSNFYISRKAYVEHHLEGRPGANPRSYYNGPIARELRDHQYFQRQGIEFKQETITSAEEQYGYKAGEVLFELTRVK